MKKLFVIVLWIGSLVAQGANYTNTASGLFSAGATWIGGTAPSLGGDTWTIAASTTVIYDVNNSATAGWGNCTNTGTLTMRNGATAGGPVYLMMNGHLAGAGFWQTGTNGNPITYTGSNTANVLIQFTNAAQCTMTTAGAINFYGTPHITNAFLSNSVAVGATSIVVSNLPAWVAANDVFWMAPTNTINGQGGDYYMVSSVAPAAGGGTTINIVTTFGGLTNQWPGTTFRASVPTQGRTVGTVIWFMGASVEILESIQGATPIITQSPSNTISCIQLQNVGKGLVNACSGWTATGNTANNCINGGLAFDCSGWTATGNTANNCNDGGLADDACSGWTATGNTANNCINGGLAYNNCSGWTATGNTANNCNSGGLAYNACSGWTATGNTANNCNSGGLANDCSGWTATGNTANNCNSGGLANACSGWTATGNTANNCNSGGLANDACSGWTATGNTANNCINGGLAYNNCSGWTATGNTANNCNSGGLADDACSGWTVFSTTNNGSGYLFYQCWSMSAFNSTSTNDVILNALGGGTSNPYGFIDYNNQIFWGINGSVTNLNGVFVHTTTAGNANQPVAYSIPFLVQPLATRNVFIGTDATNNVIYSAAVVGGQAPPQSVSVINAGANTGNWTNTILNFHNPNTFPFEASIWISSTANVGSNGFSTVNFGPDVQIFTQ